MGYTKLFSSILDSTIWQTPIHVKVVWITMLAMADQDGEVQASVPGLAIRAGVERGQCEQALAMLSAPDPDSRTPTAEGRRIEVVAGGWRLINHDVYRHKMSVEERRVKEADRKRRYRERLSRGVPDCPAVSRDVTSVPLGPAPSLEVPTSEAEAEAEADSEQRETQTRASVATIAKPGTARRWSALCERARKRVESACAERGAGNPVQVCHPDHADWILLAKWAEVVEASRADGLTAEAALDFAIGTWLDSDAVASGYNPHWFATNPNAYFLREAIEARERRMRKASA